MGVDRQLTFEILLYLNIFYFGLYAGMEAIFLLMKYYYVADMDNLTMLNEGFLLLALTGLESARLYLGQEEFIHKKISVVFRILLLTVPAQYLTLYFTFWQTKVTQVGIKHIVVGGFIFHSGGCNAGDHPAHLPVHPDDLCLPHMCTKQVKFLLINMTRKTLYSQWFVS